MTCWLNQSPVTSDLSNSGISAIPADLKASIPPSSLSRIVIHAATSHPIEFNISAAFNAEPPVVVTSSSNTTLSPDLIVEPSIPGGFPVFLPPLPLGSLRTMKPLISDPFLALAIAMAVRGTAPNSKPPMASTPPITSILSCIRTPRR